MKLIEEKKLIIIKSTIKCLNEIVKDYNFRDIFLNEYNINKYYVYTDNCFTL